MSDCVNNFEWKLVLLLEIIILSLILLLLSANVHAIHTYIIMQELEKEDVALKNHSNNGLATHMRDPLHTCTGRYIAATLSRYC